MRFDLRHRVLMFDCLWAVLFVVAVPAHVVALLGAVVLLVPAGFALRSPRLGVWLIAPRVLLGFLTLVIAADHAWLLAGAVALGLSAFSGWQLSYAARPPEQRREHSQRYDEVGSALIHLGFVGLVAVGGFFADGLFGAIGWIVAWTMLTWGTVAVHEGGHALAAVWHDSDVGDVDIGAGLTLFECGRVSVGAVPFLGLTHWTPNTYTMTTRREAYIALAGPGANVLAMLLVLASPWRAEALATAFAIAHGAMALLNVVPREVARDGQMSATDGSVALRALRRTRPA